MKIRLSWPVDTPHRWWLNTKELGLVLLEATVDAPFEETMLAAQTMEQAWHVIVGWGLPTSNAKKALLVRQLETVQMEVGCRSQDLFRSSRQAPEHPKVCGDRKRRAGNCAHNYPQPFRRVHGGEAQLSLDYA